MSRKGGMSVGMNTFIFLDQTFEITLNCSRGHDMVPQYHSQGENDSEKIESQ